MHPIRQALRQPIKTMAGILLITLAVAILCVCVGQAAAAANMRAAMEESYKTVALPTNKFLYGDDTEKTSQWLAELIAENPDMILQDSQAGLASAWIPELIPDNYIQYLRSDVATNEANSILVSNPRGAPYTCAMLEISYQSFRQLTPDWTLEDGQWCYTGLVEIEQDVTPQILVELRGTVENVLGLQEGYNDPTGYGIYLYLDVTDPQVWEAVNAFEAGDRFLTYGTDYADLDWLLRSSMMEDTTSASKGDYNATALEGFAVSQFTPENLFFINGETEEEWQALIDRGKPLKHVAYYRQDFIDENGKADYYVEVFTAYEMVRYYHKVSYTLTDYSQITGDPNHQTPTIVKLEGSAEEFLASADGALWAQTLSQMQVNNHSFPVIGVDDLRFLADYAKQNMRISQGRIFSDEELARGDRVCVISDVLAKANGLQVGDTLSAQYFTADSTFALYQDISKNQGLINPTADYFTTGAILDGEKTEYTIVGIYTQSALWDTTAENLYAFTPNTIFVPKASVPVSMKYADNGLFRTLLLKNGSMTQFEAFLSAKGLSSLFTCHDQGYSDLVDNLYSYDLIAQQALQIGLLVYFIVLALYFLLFPTRQGKEIATMSSLGAKRSRRLLHIFLSGMSVLLHGSALGIAVSIALRQEVIAALTKTADVVLPLEIDAMSLVQIGFAQLLFGAVATLLVAIPMSRNKSLMKRRSFLEHFKHLRKTPLYTWAVTVLALVVSIVLCALNASNEAEYANFEKAKQEIPITITVTDPKGEKSTGLSIKGWVADVFSGEFNWGLSQYLTDISIKMNQPITQINGQATDLRLQGIMSVSAAAEISSATGSSVTWFDGYDESILLTREPVCLVPEGFTEDADPATPAQEVALYFYAYWKETDSMGVIIDSGEYEYTGIFTVVGTYQSTVDAQDFYAPYYVARNMSSKMALSPKLESASAILKNNEELDTFLEVAYEYFLEPGPDANPDVRRQYGLKVEVGSLKKAEAVLNNSLTVNRISSYLVFILSTMAGFFVGFLMIRSRKRDILLMRTLGRSNFSIYFSFSLQQIGYLMLGIGLGGAVYRWQPMQQLLLFAALYFTGLSAALILFLNSKLITNTKEEE